MKKAAGDIDATPSKGIYSSIIADYGLRTGVCELVDNAIDQWTRNGRANRLRVKVGLELDQQSIRVEDNAGGVPWEDLRLMVTPGSGAGTGDDESIGLFGVGSKRAVVALSQDIRIRSRHRKLKTYLLHYDNEWLEDETWNLQVFEVDDVSPSSTIIELSRLRFKIDEPELERLRKLPL